MDRKEGYLTFLNAEEILGCYITKNRDDFLKILKEQQKRLKIFFYCAKKYLTMKISNKNFVFYF